MNHQLITHRGSGRVARVLRGLLGAIILVALVVNYVDATSLSNFEPIRFFSYFTILANIAAMLLMARQAAQPEWMERNGGLRGAVTLYMTITGLVYAFILRPIGADVGNYRPSIDFIEHTLAPVAVLQDWLLFPPRQPLRTGVLWSWLVFPAVYLAYSLLRGPSAGWYPYPFLDPRLEGGFPRVA
ncbi:MAG: Pr6Pr family membrane protein, partial [bacterium]